MPSEQRAASAKLCKLQSKIFRNFPNKLVPYVLTYENFEAKAQLGVKRDESFKEYEVDMNSDHYDAL